MEEELFLEELFCNEQTSIDELLKTYQEQIAQPTESFNTYCSTEPLPELPSWEELLKSFQEESNAQTVISNHSTVVEDSLKSFSEEAIPVSSAQDAITPNHSNIIEELLKSFEEETIPSSNTQTITSKEPLIELPNCKELSKSFQKEKITILSKNVHEKMTYVKVSRCAHKRIKDNIVLQENEIHIICNCCRALKKKNLKNVEVYKMNAYCACRKKAYVFQLDESLNAFCYAHLPNELVKQLSCYPMNGIIRNGNVKYLATK